MYARNGTRDVCFVYPRVFNFHFIINDDENARRQLLFSPFKFLFSAKFQKKQKKTKPTKTKQQSEIYSGLITSWIMTKKKGISSNVSHVKCCRIFLWTRRTFVQQQQQQNLATTNCE